MLDGPAHLTLSNRLTTSFFRIMDAVSRFLEKLFLATAQLQLISRLRLAQRKNNGREILKSEGSLSNGLFTQREVCLL